MQQHIGSAWAWCQSKAPHPMSLAAHLACAHALGWCWVHAPRCFFIPAVDVRWQMTAIFMRLFSAFAAACVFGLVTRPAAVHKLWQQLLPSCISHEPLPPCTARKADCGACSSSAMEQEAIRRLGATHRVSLEKLQELQSLWPLNQPAQEWPCEGWQELMGAYRH